MNPRVDQNVLLQVVAMSRTSGSFSRLRLHQLCSMQLGDCPGMAHFSRLSQDFSNSLQKIREESRMWQKYIYISSKLLKTNWILEGEWKEEISQDFHISHNIFSLHNNCTKKSRTERQEEKMKLILTSTLLALLSPWRDPSTSDGSGGIMVAEAKVRDRSH